MKDGSIIDKQYCEHNGYIAGLMADILSELILPSVTEAMMLTGAASDDEGCRMFQKRGKLVVQKNGVKGCREGPPTREEVEAFLEEHNRSSRKRRSHPF